MNQTEMFLSHARDDIDRRLIEFGYDPWHVDAFSRLSPAEKLITIRNWSRFIVRARTAGPRRRS